MNTLAASSVLVIGYREQLLPTRMPPRKKGGKNNKGGTPRKENGGGQKKDGGRGGTPRRGGRGKGKGNNKGSSGGGKSPSFAGWGNNPISKGNYPKNSDKPKEATTKPVTEEISETPLIGELRELLAAGKSQLDLKERKVDSAEMGSICQVLKNHSNGSADTMYHLDIGLNKISDEGVTKLSTVLGQGVCMKVLRLNDNNISASGTDALAQVGHA